VTLDGAWESMFWAVFQASTNPIVVLDDEERIVEINDAALALLGARRFETVGTSMQARFSPDTRPAAERTWQQMLQAGEYVGAQRILQLDGPEIEVDYASRLIEVSGRKLVVVVVLPLEKPTFSSPATTADTARLSDREREVVALVALGLETPEIAKELYISEHTVRTHVRNVMARLGARTRAHLVAIALSGQLLQLRDVRSRDG
jgi:PAS domain S-box-containing protein